MEFNQVIMIVMAVWTPMILLFNPTLLLAMLLMILGWDIRILIVKYSLQIWRIFGTISTKLRNLLWALLKQGQPMY